MAARAGFTPQELETRRRGDHAGRAGADAGGPQRSRRTRSACAFRSRRARRSRRSRTRCWSARPGAPARSARWRRSRSMPGPDRGAPREPAAQRRRSPRASKASTSAPASRRCSRPIADLHLPPSIRVEYGGAYEEQQKSFQRSAAGAGARGRAGVHRAAVRVRRLRGADRGHRRRRCSRRRRASRAAGHADDVQPVVVHGPDHGDRHRRQERHPAARRRSAVPGGGAVAGREHDPGGRAAAAADHDDGAGDGRRA